MFAVIKTGGKQYKVAKDDILKVERLAAKAGDKVQFNEVLMIGGDKVTVGAPLVDGAAVQAEVLDQIRGEKLIAFKKRRRKHNSQTRKGHRQYLSVVKVTDILASGADKSKIAAATGTGGLSAEEVAALGLGAAVAGAAGAVAAKAPKADKKPAAAKPAAKKAEPKKAEPKKAEPKKEAKAEKPAAKPAKKEEAAPAAGEAVRPSNLLKEAKGEPDDLKLISGVGPKLEKLLHENGVFHFWQVSEWTKTEIAYMDDQLSFKGRIERDNWIEQAAKLAKEAK